MSRTLKVKIITLNNVILEENIAKIFIKSKDGKLEVMAGHAPMITSIVPNITILEDLDGNKTELFTSKGVANISADEAVFCCDAAETKDEIDLERAKKAKDRAIERLKDQSMYDVERAKSSLERAELRINFKGNSK